MKSLHLWQRVPNIHNTLSKKETTSITPRMQFVQFVLVATSISNTTKCEKVIKINIDEIEIYAVAPN